MAEQLERESLYREVWETPMSRLAQRYGLSGNGLKKICRKMNIPVPTRGYWAKRAAGHRVKVMPLPPEAAETVVRHDVRPPVEDWSQPEDAKWLQARLAYEAEPAHRIEGVRRPRRWHAAVEPIRALLEQTARDVTASRQAQARYDKWPEWRKQREMPEGTHLWFWYERGGQVMPMTHRAAPVRFSLGTWRRGLALLQAVCQAGTRRGFEVRYDEEAGRIVLEGHGGKVELRMSEALEERTREVERYGGTKEVERYRVPTGRLRIHLETWGAAERMREDRPALPLEAQLNEVFGIVYKLVVKNRARVRQRQAWEEAWEREKKERAERAAREAEAQAQREAEQARCRALVEEAENWERAALIRRYVQARREGAGRREDIETWAAWALGVAEEMDSATAVD